MDKLLLIDGSNLLFQMFFGMPSRIRNASGKPVQGTLGFVGALGKIIRMTNPTRVAVLFDGEHENGRKALNEDYKANRVDYGAVPEEDNPFSQLRDVYAALDFLGVKRAETTACETDDWIAGYALTYGQEMQIVISSFDSDYFQLVNDRVSVLRYRGERSELYTPDTVLYRFGVPPERYADFKSLVGDGADNIKGVQNIGPKTAARLLNEYASLENVLLNAAQIKKPSVRESVLKNAERLKNNYRLIKLENRADLPFTPDELRYTPKTTTAVEILRAIGLLP